MELAGRGESSMVSFTRTSVNASVSSSLGFAGSVCGRHSGLLVRRPRRGVVAAATFGDLQWTSKRLQEGMVRHFNDLIRRHCERVPLGLASISQGELCVGEDGKGAGAPAEEIVGDEQTQPSGQDEKKRKTVLILMSDTGGGHRASAEAIKATFELEYGDDYQV